MAIRILNITLALLIGILVFIPFCIVWALVRLTSTGPAIHWSKRIGQNNKIFLMPKFRTMVINAPQLATHLLTKVASSQSYLTPVGSFLRKSSLDEIPQLWSIIKGDMNFVGPRPALFNQGDLRNLRTKYSIHTIAPGITGWAQINGRDELSIEEKVKFDKEYLERRSVLFDLKIIFLTVYKVLLRADITH